MFPSDFKGQIFLAKVTRVLQVIQRQSPLTVWLQTAMFMFYAGWHPWRMPSCCLPYTFVIKRSIAMFISRFRWETEAGCMIRAQTAGLDSCFFACIDSSTCILPLFPCLWNGHKYWIHSDICIIKHLIICIYQCISVFKVQCLEDHNTVYNTSQPITLLDGPLWRIGLLPYLPNGLLPSSIITD